MSYLPDRPYCATLRCVLTHWYQLRLSGEKIGSANNRRLTAITSQHRIMLRLGADAVRGAIVASVRGERPFEAPLLPIGAALFQDALPIDLVYRSLRNDSMEIRTAAIFASVFYCMSDLSVWLAEHVISGVGDKLTLQAMHEALDVRGRTSTSGTCARCGDRGTQEQRLLDWLPRRVL